MAKILTPLAPNVPIVDENGNPTPYFQSILQELSDARVSASLIDALGGDPNSNQVVVWDDTVNDLDFKSVSDVLDFIGGAGHGDILYRDSAAWARLPAGTNGKILTTHGAGADPAWESFSGAWTLIETLNPSAVASINSEAWVGGGYKALKFVLTNIAMSADDTLMAARFKLNGAYKTAANYSRITSVINTAGTAANAFSAAGTSILLTSGTATHLVGNAAAEGFSGELIVFDPDNSTQDKRCQYMSTYYNPSTVLYTAWGSGGWTGADATMALQGVQFLTAGGNFTGTIKVLGLL